MDKKLTPEEFEKTYLEKLKSNKADALAYLEEVLHSSYKNKQVKQEAKYIKAVNLFFAMHYDEARSLLASYLFSCLDYPFKTFYIDSFNLAGMIESQQDRNHLAIFYYKQALAFADEKKKVGKLPMLYSNLSIAYSYIGDYEDALLALDHALAYLSPRADPIEKSNFLLNKAFTLKNLHRYEEAGEILRQTEEANPSLNANNEVRNSIAFLHLELDAALHQEEAFQKDILVYQKTSAASELDVYALSDYKDLASLFLARGDEKRMQDSLQKIEEINEKTPQLSTNIFLADFRASYFYKKGEDHQASEQFALASKYRQEQAKATSDELERLISLHFDFVRLSKAYQKAKRRNKRLRVESNTDPLTGLLNRNALEKEEKRFLTSKRPYSVTALLDFDTFKSINDTYGHLMGDQVLSAGGMAFKEFQSPSFHVYRFGGDEFLLLFSASTSQEALAKLKTLQLRLSGLLLQTERGERIPLSVSIGYLYSPTPRPLKESLALADEELLKAKKEGRGTILGITL